MVSKGWTRPWHPSITDFRSSIENLHRIKSFGIFANFRRFKLIANTCDLSTAASQGTNCAPTQQLRGSIAGFCDVSQRKQDGRPGSRDVFSAPHDLLARAGARAPAQGKDPGGGQAAADRRVGSRVGGDRGG